MKKTITAIFFICTATLANAEYIIYLPLEQAQGGTLSDGSISITSNWIDSSTIYGEWVDQGHPYDCNNWTPGVSSIKIGESFTQTATDCSQDQTRTVQEQEVEAISGKVKDKGDPYTQSRIITVSSTRDNVGALETWIATTPTYTSWVNSGGIYGCSNWSPSDSTVPSGQKFTQAATDCKQEQTRTRQEREQETTTLTIRDKGVAVAETQIINVSSTKDSTGTMVTKVCRFIESVATYSLVYSFGTGGDYYYHWDNQHIGQTKSAELVSGSYKYTLGAYKKKEQSYIITDYYEICREPI